MNKTQTWGDVYNRYKKRGMDQSDAAYRADQWERKQIMTAENNEISPYEWMAQEFDRLAVLRKMWSAAEVAAIIRRHDIERKDINYGQKTQHKEGD